MKNRRLLNGLLWAALLLALPLRLAAAIAYDNDASVTIFNLNGSSTSQNPAIGVATGKTNQVLFVVLSDTNTLNESVSWGGTAMTQEAQFNFGNNTIYNYLYYLPNPATGTHAILITGNSGDSIGVASFSFSGVNTGSPFGTGTGVYEVANEDAQVSFQPEYSTSAMVLFSDMYETKSYNTCNGYSQSSGSTLSSSGQETLTTSGGSSGTFHYYGLSDLFTGSTSATNDTLEWTCGSVKEQLAWAFELRIASSGTNTPTVSPTETSTITPTYTPDSTNSPANTKTFTISPTVTKSPTFTASPTSTPPAGGYPTETPTITQTPTPLPTVYSGLATNMRPYGMEYVPFPTVTTSGNYQFYPLQMTFSAGTGTITGKTSPAVWGAPCNTARWQIVFQNLTVTVGNDKSRSSFQSLTVAVETRIGLYGISCTSGVYDQYAYSEATSLSLPYRPQNYSDAYFWIGVSSTASVPYTERFDAVGDPRYVPYADVLDYTGAINDGLQGGYNWFWRNFADTGTYADAAQDAFYKNFIPSAQFDHYNSEPNIDVPKLFQLIRNGVMVTNSVYTAMTGYDSYYAGEGGEIGGDTSNDFNYGIPCFGGPWGNNNNTWRVDEIIGTQESSSVNVNGSVYVVTGTSSTNISWMSLPFVGELWPDALYASQWEGNWTGNSNGGNSTWGNLANIEEGGTAYRQVMQDIPSSASPDYEQTLHRNQGPGCATFLDGTEDGSTPFNHNTNAETAAPLDNDGTEVSTEYNLSLPTTFTVNREWALNLGGNTPQEWTMSPYEGERTHLDVYSATTYTANTNWGFYADENAASSDLQKSAAALRVIDLSKVLTTTSGNPAGGWFVVNGLEPSTQSGINFVAQFAILACLRTFHDAGVPTVAASTTAPSFSNGNNTYTGSGAASGSTYRIPPIPLVTILHPTNSDPVAGMTTITIQWDERYARWDGNQYDENYPCIDANVGPCSSSNLIPNPSLEWHDPQAIAFNVIYNMPNGVSPTAWYSALTGTIVPPGPANNYTTGAAGNYMDSADAILPGSSYETSTSQYSLAWTNVASALYNVEVECFRLPSESSTVSYPHYAYHKIQVDTVP